MYNNYQGDAQLPSAQFKHAQDRGEACAIGQELLRCGLLVPICCGNNNDAITQAQNADEERDRDVGYAAIAGLPPATSTTSAVSASATGGSSGDSSAGSGGGGGDAGDGVATSSSTTGPIVPSFSDYPYYIYRFPARSATAGGVGSFTLFGAPVSASIPQWAHCEDNEEVKSSRETVSLTIGSSQPAAASSLVC